MPIPPGASIGYADDAFSPSALLASIKSVVESCRCELVSEFLVQECF